MSNKNIIVVGGTGLIGNSVLGYSSVSKSKKTSSTFSGLFGILLRVRAKIFGFFLTLIRLNQLMKSRIGIIFIYALEEN